MAHIVIDGYNYINRVMAERAVAGSGLEDLRRILLDRLAAYRKQRGGKITVVFDAGRGVSPARQRDRHLGIDVLYSREHETADDIIIEWIRERRAGMVVVTSDRAIIDEAKASGVTFLTPVRFEQTVAGEFVGGKDDAVAERAPEKRGNPRKLPKRVRRAVKRAGKL